ncbi:MAG: NAD(P)H-dependent oxidoreductase [Kofleriaceae bacterium]|nr:NAD(P)H-dependent oxidoreductase [Myxococcales bacterium]MCB9558979.1 NAD(P)H-dependent oxidoreductase [Kofleriaceae bacterium]MCB9570461.1 NAD(P)H-dependent oxidoreductase [Kofleriaceae bacterium]
MGTVILSAASAATPSLQALGAVLEDELRWVWPGEVRTFELAALELAYCQGEFDCWVKTPGVCRAHDAEQDIVRAIHDADRVVLLDAVTFGGHGYTLKRAQDRLICLLTPFFEKRAGLTHHGHRYDHAADLYALGWLPAPDLAQARTWHDLADANALNMLAARVGSAVVDDTARDDWPAAIRAMLASETRPGTSIHGRDPLRDALFVAARPTPLLDPPVPTRRVALVVGSAKIKGTSASERIARDLGDLLQCQGVEAELHFATEFIHDRGRARAAARSIADADLFVMVTPLYVDALPALATHALELVARERAASAPPARFVAVVNCGFPEPEQTRTAMRIAHHFATQARYHWAGGLPLGGGGVVKPDVPLDEQHGPAAHVHQALVAAATPLAGGDVVPGAALRLMARSPLPDVAYRLIGDLGWRYQVHQHGLSQRALRARPLDVVD